MSTLGKWALLALRSSFEGCSWTGILQCRRRIRGQREDERYADAVQLLKLLTHEIDYTVDENLFYKGVDKSAVHGARLHQVHNADPAADSQSEHTSGSHQPPYPFVVRSINTVGGSPGLTFDQFS